jgi:hypothetical protein
MLWSFKGKASRNLEPLMDRNIVWSIGLGALLASAAGVAVLVPEHKDLAFDFIPGNRAVTELQVREKLDSDGWTNIKVVLRGRIFVATASKGNETRAFFVDSLNGRLRGEDDDDDEPPNEDLLQ